MTADIRFGFCPKCASSRVGKPTSRFHECPDCGFVLYHNIAAAAALILECRGRLLVTVRRNDPGRDLLGLPGGFVDPGESAEDGLRREVREEVGWDVQQMRYFCSFPNLYPFRGITYDTLDLFFSAACAEEPPIQPRDEVKDLQWFPRAALPLERFAFSSMRKALTAYLQTPLPALRPSGM